ncbi:Outer membrane porin F precursor [Enhygromyxa salina]|uniref:Outer membrane porin F n=1 Tax=Enhygromyxa salina TaxID=215803 RepID=A0A2S9XH25_9BACT|nr:OmpA family protein [Enhygromyxa salina]PRP92184.1 Outer membrane porin F precursor [Enhygromyxa salina]
MTDHSPAPLSRAPTLRRAYLTLTAGLALMTPALAEAGEPDSGGASLSASASTDDGASGEASAEGEGREPRAERWIDRHAPEPMMLELGVWGGVLFPSSQLELFEAELGLPDQGRKLYGHVAPDLGLRLGFYPLRHFGVEVEGGVMPASLRDESGKPLIWAGRGHLVGQIGLWRLTPFIVAGAGAMGVASPRSAVGSEADIGVHFGGGLKFFINYWLMLRLDVRDNLTNRIGVGEGVTHSPEILLGLSVTLNRKSEKPLRDRDGDGIPDRDDQCPREPGPAPSGCPPDADQDEIPDDEDKCPTEPETKNGFDDDDGCPDIVPSEFADLAGILEGINFDSDKDKIKKESKPILDRAVEVLQQYPQVRIEISGHTDSNGGYEHNVDLSQRRAEAVKQYLIDNDIDGGRIETRGAGPNEPIDTNDTKAGRAENRRIEVKILTH